MVSGLVFDVKEFAVHDGPGIRTTVFLKGCPLCCSWCHNPEGISSKPQIMRGLVGERVVGRWYTSTELAKLLNKQADVLKMNEGGVTFSGGEPLMQAKFVAAVIDLLNGISVLLDTSGYSKEGDFRLLAERSDLVYYDLKLIEVDMHKEYCGKSNQPILRNLRVLSEMNVPFVIRVPLIPGVTDTDKNLGEIAKIISDLKVHSPVDLLPYNRAAGAKYKACGMEFKPRFDESRDVRINTRIFENEGLEVRVL